jgi:hypothetical protein
LKRCKIAPSLLDAELEQPVLGRQMQEIVGGRCSLSCLGLSFFFFIFLTFMWRHSKRGVAELKLTPELRPSVEYLDYRIDPVATTGINTSVGVSTSYLLRHHLHPRHKSPTIVAVSATTRST